jgi:serine/threonine protein kinase
MALFLSPQQQQNLASHQQTLAPLYSVHKIIGEGTFGQVLLGHDHSAIGTNSQHIAVKVLKKHPSFLPIIRHEVDVLQKVSHPNIVHLQNFLESEEFVYLVFEVPHFYTINI